MVKLGFAALAFVLTGCFLVKGDREDFVMTRQPLSIGTFRIDGYYYSYRDSTDYMTVYIFYDNGVVMRCGAFKRDNFDDMHRDLRSDLYGSKSKDVPWMWGIAKVKKDSISFEMLDIKGHDYIAVIRKGILLNDSTFVLKEYVTSHDTTRWKLDEVYHFRHFAFKPDSLNNIVK